MSCAINAQKYVPIDYILDFRNNYTPVESALGGMPSLVSPTSYSHIYNSPIASMINNKKLDYTYRYHNNDGGLSRRYGALRLNYNLGDIGYFAFSYQRYDASSSPTCPHI